MTRDEFQALSEEEVDLLCSVWPAWAEDLGYYEIEAVLRIYDAYPSLTAKECEAMTFEITYAFLSVLTYKELERTI